MVELEYFGHSSFGITAQKRLLIDPFFHHDATINDKLPRLIPFSAKLKDLQDASIILVTHEHTDHFDKELLEQIAKKNDCLIVAHDFLLRELKNIPKRQLVPIVADNKLQLRGFTIKALPAHHPQAFFPLSFMVEADGVNIFHAGDTDLMDEHEKIKCDVALLPIGGADTMDVVDAVKATKCIKPKIAVPMRYNTFSFLKVDPNEFKDRIEKSNLKTKAIIMKPGDKIKV